MHFDWDSDAILAIPINLRGKCSVQYVDDCRADCDVTTLSKFRGNLSVVHHIPLILRMVQLYLGHVDGSVCSCASAEGINVRG